MSIAAVARSLALAALGVVALAAPGLANAKPSNISLLRIYQPVTVFDPAEQFRPTNVRSFVSDTDLERFENGSWVVVNADPRPKSLPADGTVRLDQDRCSPAMTLGGLACYADAAQRSGGRNTVYGRVVRTGDAVVLQYWYFYYDDVYSYAYPPSDLIWQAHEGDWEVVSVVLSDGNEPEPLQLGYSQHCGGERREWTATARFDGTHPVVYVAVGSHANYFAPGPHQIDPACLPPAAIALLIQHGLPLPVDFTGLGAVAGPAVAGGETTRVKQLRDEHPTWLAFPGTWGEQQYFHSPFSGTVPLGASPVGPAFHAVWTDPLGTIASYHG
jgi:Necrosis inducing protein (NPP1)